MQPQNAPSATVQATAAEEPAPVIPLKHPVRNAFAAIIVVVAALAAIDVALNERYHWDVVVDYLFAPRILTGAALTLMLTVVSMSVGISLGAVLAIMRLSENPILSTDRPRLHLVLPRHPAAGAADLLVQHCGPLPGHRPGPSLRRPLDRPGLGQRADHPAGRGPAGPVAERGRLHGRDHPRRHRLGGPRPVRRRRRRWA